MHVFEQASTTWEKWNFEETGRAEMPLTNNNDETFPMGLAFDLSSTRPVVVGEKQLPPAPIMMLLSTDGVLCPFYMINQTPHANYDIIKALEPLPPGGQRKRIVSNKGNVCQPPRGKASYSVQCEKMGGGGGGGGGLLPLSYFCEYYMHGYQHPLAMLSQVCVMSLVGETSGANKITNNAINLPW